MHEMQLVPALFQQIRPESKKTSCFLTCECMTNYLERHVPYRKSKRNPLACLPVNSPLFISTAWEGPFLFSGPGVSYVAGIKTPEKDYALKTKCIEAICSIFQ